MPIILPVHESNSIWMMITKANLMNQALILGMAFQFEILAKHFLERVISKQ